MSLSLRINSQMSQGTSEVQIFELCVCFFRPICEVEKLQDAPFVVWEKVFITQRVLDLVRHVLMASDRRHFFIVICEKRSRVRRRGPRKTFEVNFLYLSQRRDVSFPI
jgi:hypothetical protein